MATLAAIASAALFLQTVYTKQVRAEADQRPNIIFIMADDLGYGDLGCYGQKRIQTPNIDRLAAEGMRFTDFYAGSTVCAPSRCVLMTGYHTGHALIRGNARVDLRPDDVTVAEVLKTRGYKTALCGKWGLGSEGGTGAPNKQGFDFFYGYLDQGHAHNYYPEFLIRNDKRVALKNEVPGNNKSGRGKASKKVEYSHDLIMEEALGFVDSAKDGPFFLYLALTIPHANNEAGREGMEVPDYGIYADTDWPEPQKGHAAMISRMDSDVGRLMARLKKHGIDENTIVFFTSDNGPHSEGGNDPSFQDSNGPLRGIKRSLHDGGIRAPFIARAPGRIPAGVKSDHVGCFQDMLPTLATYAGADRDTYPTDIDGVAFTATLHQSGQQIEHNHLFWAFYEGGAGRAIRMGHWKAVQQPYKSPIRLYDLSEDIGEMNDLAAEHPDIVAKLEKAMDQSYEPSSRWKFPEKQ